MVLAAKRTFFALWIAAGLVAGGHAAVAADEIEAGGGTVCLLEPGPTRAVTAVLDAETVVLDDGSEVRLIGALAPRPPDSIHDIAYWEPEREAKRTLEQLVLGKSVVLGFSGRRSDRYDRTLAHLFVTGGDEPQWVQAALLATGHARAYGTRDNHGCLRELLAHEAIARTAGMGLWMHAAYHARDAGNAFELMRLRSTFQIVEGLVAEVIAGKHNMLIRFEDAHWRRPATASTEDDRAPRGFSLSLKPAVAHAWTSAGLALSDVAGRRLRVRGWIERRGGPTIEIVDPLQIELVNAAGEPIVADAVASGGPATERRRSRRAARATAGSGDQ